MVMGSLYDRKIMVLAKRMAVEMVTKITMMIALMVKPTMAKAIMLGYIDDWKNWKRQLLCPVICFHPYRKSRINEDLILRPVTNRIVGSACMVCSTYMVLC